MKAYIFKSMREATRGSFYVLNRTLIENNNNINCRIEALMSLKSPSTTLIAIVLFLLLFVNYKIKFK